MQELAFGTQQVDFEKGADNTRINGSVTLKRWARDVYSFVCGRYGEQNIAAFIVHLDELNPHIHCTLLPIKDSRFAYKEKSSPVRISLNIVQRMKQLHTDFSQKSIQSGECQEEQHIETGARHRTTEEYRRMLSEECTTIEDNIKLHQQVLGELQSDIGWQNTESKGLRQWLAILKSRKLKKKPCYRQPSTI